MPTYSFICQKCKNNFDLYASFEEYDKKDPKKFRCPNCGSIKIQQNFSNIIFNNKSGKEKKQWCCGCDR